MKTRYSPGTGNFYPFDIEYPNLPADVIEVSRDDYDAAMSRPVGHSFTFVNGQLVISAPPALTLDQLKAAKLAELRGEMSRRIASVKAGYPDEEVASWPEQKAEATAYSADKTAATPFLSAMAAARSIPVADLAPRVLSNAQAWSEISGELIGKRQAYEDQVSAAADAAAVAAIVWID